ncbi:DUF4326 domain-containing protein [Kitasatospora kifunensis]|uniref:DUF4326 domain-containing protein n=1 Tax=Kitasatospora kifunensis TaxID=58351 RepID=A0A7W7VU06_KITKI|nr:DUF4326 domain-containing protein [Kitasatospora kifunensis]MBB4922169.1 hypothetical protein [Kitasatospora kifunensis]
MTAPTRIQRRRTKGWRCPDNTVIVSRPSRFGNPFTIQGCIDAEWTDSVAEARRICTQTFEEWLDGNLLGGPGPDGTAWSAQRLDWINSHLVDLRSKNLACYCPLPEPGQPDHCHAAVLLRLANLTTGEPL